MCVCVSWNNGVNVDKDKRRNNSSSGFWDERKRMEVLVPAQRRTGERACWENRCQDACKYKMVL